MVGVFDAPPLPGSVTPPSGSDSSATQAPTHTTANKAKYFFMVLGETRHAADLLASEQEFAE